MDFKDELTLAQGQIDALREEVLKLGTEVSDLKKEIGFYKDLSDSYFSLLQGGVK